MRFAHLRRLAAVAPLAMIVACSSAPPKDEDPTSTAAAADSVPPGCTAPGGIVDLGYADFRVSNADVNGDGIADYCRFVGDAPNIFLSCQPGCPSGNYGYPWAWNSIPGLDRGYVSQPRWMTDVNGDGRADFCRWVGDPPNEFFACDLFNGSGFDASQFEVSLPANVQPFTLTIEQVEPQTPIENRPLYVHFALTNNMPFAQSGFVGAHAYPKHGAEYENVWGEWQVNQIGPGQTIRGVAAINTPHADPGVSVSVYYVHDHKNAGEFNVIEGPHLAQSSPVSFDVAARYEVSLDDVNIQRTRAKNTDTDYVALKVISNGGTVFDNGGSPLFLGNVQDGVHAVGLSSGAFDLVPSDGASVDISWTVMNEGASTEHATEKVLDGISSIAAGVLSIAYPGTGQTWTRVDDFTRYLNSLQFAGCDGAVALDHMTATSNVLEYKTYDDTNQTHDFHDTRYYDWNGDDHAYDSQAGCGSSPRYAIDWTLHRVGPIEIESAWPTQGMVKPGGTVQFSAPDANLRWSVDGNAADVGWIDEQTGLYHAPAVLPIDRLIEIRVETADGAKHNSVFVSLDPR